jgi:hypothetical protein
MWRKKKWVIIAVVVAVVVLAAGILGGVAYAQAPTSTGKDTSKTLLGRVATILGIDQKKVEDAYSQAQKDMRNEGEKARLDQMVKDGKLTQEQADKYQSWLNSRPNVPANLDGVPRMGMGKGRMGFGGGFPCFPGNMGGKAPAPSATPTN